MEWQSIRGSTGLPVLSGPSFLFPGQRCSVKVGGSREGKHPRAGDQNADELDDVHVLHRVIVPAPGLLCRRRILEQIFGL